MKKYFIYTDAKSDKFWSVEVKGKIMTVVYGKRGTAGTTNRKELAGVYNAAKEADRLVSEKLKKGYKEITGKKAGKFGEAEFWGLIERAKSKTHDSQEQIEFLIALLAERPVEDIIAFEKIFLQLHADSYRSDLWAAAYIIKGGCSDDGFDYFRGWLIAQGKDIFYNALKNADSLTRVVKTGDPDEVECEEMLNAAPMAYAHKTGEDDGEIYNHIPPGSIRHRKINLDWNEDGDDLKNRFPKLWKKFTY